MKKCVGAIVSIFLFLPPVANAAAPSPAAPIALSPLNAVTAGDFALACREGQDGQDGQNGHDECDDVVGTALLLGLDYSKPIGVCLPGTDYSDGVDPWLRAHPETSRMPVYDGIMLAITALYPCGAK